MSRAAFELVFNLTTQQPWLKVKQSSLSNLIDCCGNAEEQYLICDLLRRFTYLDNSTFSDALRLIADHIEKGWCLSPENTLISARENSKFSDSSQLVAYNLKAGGQLHGAWTTNRFLSRLRDIENSEVEHVILVDEFIGTGETMQKSVEYLRKKSVEWSQKFKIFVAVVAGMEFGLKRVCDVADSVYAVHSLRKGISDHYSELDREQRILNMIRLEETLANMSNRGKLATHSLGYKKSEALYARHEGNTPNNVFPIFWWESDRDGNDREPILKCR